MQCSKHSAEMRLVKRYRDTDGQWIRIWRCEHCPPPYNEELEPEREVSEPLDWVGIYGIPPAWGRAPGNPLE